ncbi:hypothetical protein [Streptomyces fuscigenes]|uniref:hypothetical protein n=1 Tax=Streptomyces fuscigenes TaxID=1528880 RepID=UPI001F29A22F|nr:hypothetical protein [Streptomyces fuscigenes]MCF3964896.1 hypothetical protein [Streptomyces fuscigenes]
MLTAHLSDTGWIVLAVLAGLALGVSLMTMGETWPKRLALLVVPPLGSFVFTLGRSLATGDSWRVPLYLYTLVALSMAATRLIYTPWIRRQAALRRAGEPVAVVKGRHSALALFTMLAVFVGLAFLIH